MDDCKPIGTPLATVIKLDVAAASTAHGTEYPFRELLRALVYIAIATRPDICHAVNELSQYNNSHNLVHWQAAKRILRYLEGTINKKLTYVKDKEGIFSFADADWGNSDADRKSYTGYYFILCKSAISWCSRKQRIVALSSTEYLRSSKGGNSPINLREGAGFSAAVKSCTVQ
ncbi:uncharacterized protein LOC126481906 [Schistocerca serialis cubense]|uniref:uncharacterized protein LOC126481906 n=1 Tax=Schistocerca serialis cubense TaxID=2023355 RepID=UPI00214E4B8E|nr:uncharacterized protein LOC126481906 [Schistocerca serialis cubense]